MWQEFSLQVKKHLDNQHEDSFIKSIKHQHETEPFIMNICIVQRKHTVFVKCIRLQLIINNYCGLSIIDCKIV